MATVNDSNTFELNDFDFDSPSGKLLSLLLGNPSRKCCNLKLVAPELLDPSPVPPLTSIGAHGISDFFLFTRRYCVRDHNRMRVGSNDITRAADEICCRFCRCRYEFHGCR